MKWNIILAVSVLIVAIGGPIAWYVRHTRSSAAIGSSTIGVSGREQQHLQAERTVSRAKPEYHEEPRSAATGGEYSTKPLRVDTNSTQKADATISITGIVRDHEGKPIQSALVALSGKLVTTDSLGRFAVRYDPDRRAAPGVYVEEGVMLKFMRSTEKPGFLQRKCDVSSVRPGETLTIKDVVFPFCDETIGMKVKMIGDRKFFPQPVCYLTLVSKDGSFHTSLTAKWSDDGACTFQASGFPEGEYVLSNAGSPGKARPPEARLQEYDVVLTSGRVTEVVFEVAPK